MVRSVVERAFAAPISSLTPFKFDPVYVYRLRLRSQFPRQQLPHRQDIELLTNAEARGVGGGQGEAPTRAQEVGQNRNPLV